MKIATIGIDLAKEVFAIPGVDVNGHTVLRKDKAKNNFPKLSQQFILETRNFSLVTGSGCQNKIS